MALMERPAPVCGFDKVRAKVGASNEGIYDRGYLRCRSTAASISAVT